MPKQSTAQVEQGHAHYFREGYNQSGNYCSCGAIQVSAEEYQHRIDAWNSYFSLIKDTPACQDFLELKRVWPHLDLMEPVLKRVRGRGHWGVNEYGDRVWEVDEVQFADKPHFPDPSTWNRYEVII
jgi:hypothetical protein